jgi:hypothetical protein
MIDAGDPPAKLFHGERLHHLALEIVEPARQPTSEAASRRDSGVIRGMA